MRKILVEPAGVESPRAGVRLGAVAVMPNAVLRLTGVEDMVMKLRKWLVEGCCYCLENLLLLLFFSEFVSKFNKLMKWACNADCK